MSRTVVRTNRSTRTHQKPALHRPYCASDTSTDVTGFHRPYITLEEAKLFSSDVLEDIYDLGITTVFDIIEIANQREPWGTARMIEPDLLQRIIGTPGDEMFYITTVEEAGRWNIEIEGLPETLGSGKLGPQYACENMLAWPTALTSDLHDSGVLTDDIFHFGSLNAWSVTTLAQTDAPHHGRRISVTSLRSGYSVIGCEVVLRDTHGSLCGYDGATDIRIGNCVTGDDLRYTPVTAFSHPRTALSTLKLPDPYGADARRFAWCEIYDDAGTRTDREICLQSVMLRMKNGTPLAQHFLDWPSGARTVVQVEAAPYGETASEPRINGLEGARERKGGADCVRNLQSGNTLCISR